MLTPIFKKDNKTAKLLIWFVSAAVFAAVVFIVNVKLFKGVDLGFNVHVLALVNAIINGTVSILLVWALIAIKNKRFVLHKNLMMVSIVLSSLFLVTYVAHHLLADETKFGGVHDWFFFVYLFILISHIALATIILPFVLFSAYWALSGDYEKHKKLSKYTWPLWLYVSVTGVLVYLMISPYYIPHI